MPRDPPDRKVVPSPAEHLGQPNDLHDQALVVVVAATAASDCRFLGSHAASASSLHLVHFLPPAHLANCACRASIRCFADRPMGADPVWQGGTRGVRGVIGMVAAGDGWPGGLRRSLWCLTTGNSVLRRVATALVIQHPRVGVGFVWNRDRTGQGILEVLRERLSTWRGRFGTPPFLWRR